MVTAKDEEIKEMLRRKENVEYYRQRSGGRAEVFGKVFIKDIRNRTMVVHVSRVEMENRLEVDAGLRKEFRRLLGEEVEIQIEDRKTTTYVNQGGKRVMIEWDRGDRVVRLSNIEEGREEIIVDGPCMVNMGRIGVRRVEMKFAGGRRVCKLCGGMRL